MENENVEIRKSYRLGSTTSIINSVRTSINLQNYLSKGATVQSGSIIWVGLVAKVHPYDVPVPIKCQAAALNQLDASARE